MNQPSDALRQDWQKVNQAFTKAIFDYHLIEDEDQILVAVSGGKDSLILLRLLAERVRIFKPRFHVHAVHVTMQIKDAESRVVTPYQSDTTWMQQFADELHVPFTILPAAFEQRNDAEKQPCFLCSWNRRKVLFDYAKQLGFNKIALGHHQDDLLTTTLMNLFLQGRFDTMPAVLHLDKMPLQIIRPLSLCREATLQRIAAAENFPKQLKNCPFEHESERERFKQLFWQMEQENPEVRFNLWHAVERANLLLR